MKTLLQDLDDFKKLSDSRKRALKRDARIFKAENKSLGNANGFWRSLSANQVSEVEK